MRIGLALIFYWCFDFLDLVLVTGLRFRGRWVGCFGHGLVLLTLCVVLAAWLGILFDLLLAC